MFLYSRISRLAVNRRTKDAKSIRKRDFPFKYHFQGDDGVDREVCQYFFIRTLGYKSHKVIQTVTTDSDLSSPPTSDRRGGDRTSVEGQEEKTATLLDINAHIQSYGPTINQKGSCA